MEERSSRPEVKITGGKALVQTNTGIYYGTLERIDTRYGTALMSDAWTVPIEYTLAENTAGELIDTYGTNITDGINLTIAPDDFAQYPKGTITSLASEGIVVAQKERIGNTIGGTADILSLTGVVAVAPIINERVMQSFANPYSGMDDITINIALEMPSQVKQEEIHNLHDATTSVTPTDAGKKNTNTAVRGGRCKEANSPFYKHFIEKFGKSASNKICESLVEILKKEPNGLSAEEGYAKVARRLNLPEDIINFPAKSPDGSTYRLFDNAVLSAVARLKGKGVIQQFGDHNVWRLL
jgi:hypothetical protein